MRREPHLRSLVTGGDTAPSRKCAPSATDRGVTSVSRLAVWLAGPRGRGPTPNGSTIERPATECAERPPT